MNENILLFFSDSVDIYWHGALMGAAVLLGYILFWVFSSVISKEASSPVKYIVLLSFPLGLALARLQYCFFNQDEFRSNISEVLNLSQGGFGLFGAVGGFVASVFLVAMVNKRMKIRELLDAGAVAGALSICIGRASCFFSGEELGFEITKEEYRRLMFVQYLEDGGVWCIRVYVYEAIAAAVMFVSLLFTFFAVYGKKGKLIKGSVAVSFLFIYSITQILFESWRSDSLFLNLLGFVRFSQALCAVILFVLLVVFCVRYAKIYGFKGGQIFMWIGLLLFFALAFTCEFTMTAGTRMRNYLGMIIGLVGMFIIGRVLYGKTQLAQPNAKQQ